MKNLLSLLRLPSLRSFGRDEGGTVVAEAVIVLPLFLWSYIALFVYWDAFRSMNTVQKAAYTLSDMLSREQKSINQNYVDGMGDLLEYLIDENQDAKLRVSAVTWSDANQQYEIYWSASPENSLTPLTTATLQEFSYEIPVMSVGDTAIIVEVEVAYQPTFDIGMPDQTFKQFVVTRPRFNCIPMDGVSVGCPSQT